MAQAHDKPQQSGARLALACVAIAALASGLAACGQKKTELGEGGSVVTGSAGPAGAQNAAHELVKCEAPVGEKDAWVDHALKVVGESLGDSATP